MLHYTKRINSPVHNAYNREKKWAREHPLVLALGTTTARISGAGLCSDEESMILLLSSIWMATVIN